MTQMDPKVTKYLYLVIMLCYLLCHIDSGIMAVSNQSIQDDLNIAEAEVGLIATGLYIGNVVGSLISPFLFAKFHAKYILVLASIGNAVSVSLFAYIHNYWVFFTSRILAGFF